MIHHTHFRGKRLFGLVLLIAWTSALDTSTARQGGRFHVQDANNKGQFQRNRGQRAWNDWDDDNERRIRRLMDIIASSSGNGRELRKMRDEDEDEKKTLSQQVKEGKYGLIQNEIYGKAPRRPGVISYSSNPEVPKDTIDNFGGLSKDDIWLAENHLLVLKGGNFPKDDGNSNNPSSDAQKDWPPIDDYQAPRRQVQIPANPQVPPPFVVQLRDGGPIEIIGFNDTERGTTESDLNPFRQDGGDALPRGVYQHDKNGRVGAPPPPPPPFFYPVSPIFVLPPIKNATADYDDEEDQSIYYPPPYSFVYKVNKSMAVPPGPLVPGIILPPPPDFFAPLDDKHEKKNSTTKKQIKSSTSMPHRKIRPTYLPPRKLAPQKQHTHSHVRTTTEKTITTKARTRKRTRKPQTSLERRFLKKSTKVNPTNVTTPYENDSTTPLSTHRTVTDENKSTVPFHSPSTTWDDYPSTTPVSTSQPLEISVKSVPPSSGVFRIEVTPATVNVEQTTANHPEKISNRALYYFYQDPTDNNAGSTVTPSNVEYQTNTESPYFVQKLTQQSTTQRQIYSVNADDNFRRYNVPTSIETPQIYNYNRAELSNTPRYDSVPIRESNQQVLADQTPFYGTIPSHPAVVSNTPSYSAKQAAKPKPIYQYSFQAADYSKRVDSNPYYNSQAQGLTRARYTNPSAPHEDYQTRLTYPSTTARSIPNVTPNPQYAYFTKQDEKLLDNVTKQYFTMFGKKLGGKSTPSTTPIYEKVDTITERPNYNVNTYVPNNYNVESTYKNQVYNDAQEFPPNLKNDIRVNYQKYRPPINPDSEYIDVFDPNGHEGSRYEQLQQQVNQPISLKDDILVNYRDPRPSINPDAEFIDPVAISRANVRSGNPNAYYSYQLPGDGGHVYFLTPQALPQRQEQAIDGGYLYPKLTGPRFARRKRNVGHV